uniref:Putative viral coat protein n=1 Tax=Little cherry virus 1 TaxID=217686 RepID=A0A140KPQ0_9CLOS|nr:putative viral coat protein [Little cherry virus 1]
MNFYDSYTISRISFRDIQAKIKLSSVETCIAVNKTYYVTIGDTNNNIRFFLLSPDHISLNWRFGIELTVNDKLLNEDQSNEYIINNSGFDVSDVDPRELQISATGFNDILNIELNGNNLMNIRQTFLTKKGIIYGVNEYYNKNLLKILDEFAGVNSIIKSPRYSIEILLDGKPYLGSWYLNDGPNHKSIAYVKNKLENINTVLDLIENNYGKMNLLDVGLKESVDLEVNLNNNNCLRIYDVIKCSDEIHEAVALCELQTTVEEKINVILQYWIGDGNDILEFVLRCKNSYFGCEVWKNSIGRYSKLTEFTKYHSFTKYYGSGCILIGFYYDDRFHSYVFTINGIIACMVKNDLLNANYEVGFEYQVFGEGAKTFNMKNFKRLKSNNKIYKLLRYPYPLVRPDSSDMTNHHINNNISTNKEVLLTEVSKIDDLFDIPESRPTIEMGSKSKETKRPRIGSDSDGEQDLNPPFELKQVPITKSSELIKSTMQINLDNSSIESKPNYVWVFEYAKECDEVISIIAKAIQISIPDAKLVVFQMAICCGTSIESVHDKHTSLIFNFLNNKRIYLRFIATCFFRKNARINLFRRYMRSCTAEVLELLRIGKLSPSLGRAIKLGIDKQFAFLACDFWSFDEMKLTTQEHEVIGNLKSVRKSNQRIHLLRN